jgi:hypothetical protein
MTFPSNIRKFIQHECCSFCITEKRRNKITKDVSKSYFITCNSGRYYMSRVKDVYIMYKVII